MKTLNSRTPCRCSERVCVLVDHGPTLPVIDGGVGRHSGSTRLCCSQRVETLEKSCSRMWDRVKPCVQDCGAMAGLGLS